MTTKLVNGKRVTLTPQEDIELALDRATAISQEALDATQRKKDELIAYEKEQAIEALITSKKASINNMSDTALDAAILAAGLR